MAFYDEPQWAVVGDTFPVGCEPQGSIVYGKPSFKKNPDMQRNRAAFVEWGGQHHSAQPRKNHREAKHLVGVKEKWDLHGLMDLGTGTSASLR